MYMYFRILIKTILYKIGEIILSILVLNYFNKDIKKSIKLTLSIEFIHTIYYYFYELYWKTNVEDNVMLFLETQETELTINISITEWESIFRLEIFGEDGAIYFSGRSNNYGSQKIRFVKRWFWDQNSQDEIWEFSNNENSFLNELTDFCNVIEGGESDRLATPQDGYRAIEIIENLYKSPNRFISL